MVQFLSQGGASNTSEVPEVQGYNLCDVHFQVVKRSLGGFGEALQSCEWRSLCALRMLDTYQLFMMFGGLYWLVGLYFNSKDLLLATEVLIWSGTQWRQSVSIGAICIREFWTRIPNKTNCMDFLHGDWYPMANHSVDISKSTNVSQRITW